MLTMIKYYTLIVMKKKAYTASELDYADTIINYIERNKNYFKIRLYRNNCIFV